MYSGAFFLSSSGVFIGFKSWNLSHSLKFGIFLATSYDLSHRDTVLFLIINRLGMFSINYNQTIKTKIESLMVSMVAGWVSTFTGHV
jgi:hypothetical protein